MTKDTSKFDAVEMIAFRDRDMEGDIWCEKVFLFETNNDVIAFFTPENPILISTYTEGDAPFLSNFNIHNSPSNYITAISFFTEYAGDVILYRMDRGFVCKIN